MAKVVLIVIESISSTLHIYSLVDRIRKQELRYGVLSQQWLDIVDRIGRLFSKAGVTLEEDFRQRATLLETFVTLQQDRRLLISSLAAGLGSQNKALPREHMGGTI